MSTPTPAKVVAALSAVVALGCAVLAVAHAGVEIPLVSRLGPGGSRAVPPAVIAFSAGAVVMAFVAVGAARVRPWAWALGLVAHALVFMGAVMPYRGVGSLVAMVLAAATVTVLLSRSGRETFVASPAAS